MNRILLGKALFYYVPRNESIIIDGYCNNKVFKNTEEFRNSLSVDMEECSVELFTVNDGILKIVLC